MRGSQCDAIEERRKAIKEVLLTDSDRIAGMIALGTLVRGIDCHGDETWTPESLLYIKGEVDMMLGINI